MLCKHFNPCFFPLKKKGLKIICLSDFPLFQVSQVFISYSNVLKTWHPCAHVNFMVNSKLSLSLSLSPSPSPWQSTAGSGRKKYTGLVNRLHSALESKNRYRTLFLFKAARQHITVNLAQPVSCTLSKFYWSIVIWKSPLNSKHCRFDHLYKWTIEKIVTRSLVQKYVPCTFHPILNLMDCIQLEIHIRYSQ